MSNSRPKSNPTPTRAFKIHPTSLTTPTNTTTLITGGSAGIGLATAKLLHSLPNNNVAILDLSPPSPPPSAPQSQSLIESPRFLYVQCDVTSWSSQRAAFKAVATRFGRIDNVFVNAGIAEYGDQFFKDEVDAQGELREPDRRTVDVDLRAAGDTVRLAVWWLRRNRDRGASTGGSGSGSESGSESTGGKGGGGGSIVLTASLAGYLASAGAPLYSAAKHGIVGLMRALKNDLATLNIAISVVGPGITLTEIVSGRRPGQTLEEWAVEMRGKGVPINDAREVAAAVVWLMGKGMEANGMGLVIQAGLCADVEGGIARSRGVWMGEEMLRLFRGGRAAPLFPNKL